MKNLRTIKRLLLLLLCLSLAGCGSTGEEAAAGTIENTSTSENPGAEEDTDSEKVLATNRDTYKTLAETNIVLQRKKTDLTLECTYYENIILNQSAQYFEKKDVTADLLTGNESDPGTEYSPARYPELNTDYQADISIPEIADSELESCIAELQAENEELTAQISYLSDQIDAYKEQCGLR